MRNNKLEESVVLALQGKLNEDKEIKTEATDPRGEEIEEQVEINGIKRTLYWQAEKDCFEAMKRTISGLEKFVVGYDIDFLGGHKEAYITFSSSGKNSEFMVKFDPETFGKVTDVQTTYSNLDITSDFLKLAQLLYELKK